MKLYRISNWDKFFENNRSRTVEELSWIRIPNRHDGENYTQVVNHQDGAKVFSAFILMAEVASKCDPRGTLIRGSGHPHTAASLSTVTRAPLEWFTCALSHLANHTDWVEVQEVPDEWQRDVNGLPPNWQRGDERGEEKRGDKKRREKDPPLAFCFPLKFSSSFKKQWSKWVEHRQAYKEPKSGWQPMFEKQLAWIERYEEPIALEIMDLSMRNGWQGLFEPKQQASKQKQKGGCVPNI
jgi:hypothetical protein